MKTLILGNEARVNKYRSYCQIPEDMELVFANPYLSDDEILAVCDDAEFIMSDPMGRVSGNLIANMPNLKLIHSEGVGFNGIDIEKAKELGIFVCNNQGINAAAVAEQTILLMLGLLRSVIIGDRQVRNAKQIEMKEKLMVEGIRELRDCHIGLIGFGDIAKETALRLKAFGCRVSYYSRRKKSQEEEEEYGVSYMPLAVLAKECDIISLHVPVTKETVNMINEDFLGLMKPTSYIVNTARGDIVDQEALREALEKGTIAGAGLDTLYPEPVCSDNPLLNLSEDSKDKILFSPHLGGITEGAFIRSHSTVWENITRVLKGERPVHIVNGVEKIRVK